jgi:hypothetical protein
MKVALPIWNGRISPVFDTARRLAADEVGVFGRGTESGVNISKNENTENNAGTMKTYFECIPCFVRQAIETARRVTDDKAVQEEVIRKVLRAVSEMDMQKTPPIMNQALF